MVASGQTSRRGFLQRALAASAAGVSVPIAALARDADAAEEGAGPYGPLLGDETGVLLPEGFAIEIVAITGDAVADTGYVWRGAPDGAAVFDDGAGGWYHAVNHETSPDSGGGVSVLHFDAAGRVLDAYSILDGTDRNCAGGPTPWGTWLSCEETSTGMVWECTPGQPSQGVARPGLGVFKHEAVAVDPVRQRLYLTEDRGRGLLYRFTPGAYPDLDSGLLEAAVVSAGVVDWVPVPDPSARDTDTRDQLSGVATTFDGGEGIWYHNDRVYFTTKGDHSVWDLDVSSGVLSRIWAGDPRDPARDQLTGVDNLTVESGSGDVYVAEDGGNMEIVVITPEGTVSPFLRVLGHDGSELTGPVFTPRGDRMMFSSQRGSDGRGVTYMVTGPFRGGPGGAESATVAPSPPATSTPPPVEASPTTTPSPIPAREEAPEQTTEETGDDDAEQAMPAPRTIVLDPETPDPATTFVAADDDGFDARIAFGAAGVAAALAGAGLLELRRRRRDEEADD